MVVLYPHPDGPPFGSSESEDDKVGNLERLIFAGFPFTKAFWCSGDGSLPSLYTSRRRKEITATSTTSDSDSSEMQRQRKSSKPKFINTAEDVTTLLDKKLKGFKASLLADLRGMMRANESPPAVQSPKGKSPSHVSEARSSEPSRVTRSGRVGQYVRVPTAPGHSLSQRDGTRSDTIEPEGSTSATCNAKKNSHPPSSRPTSPTAVPQFSSQPPSPSSTAREQPLEPPAVSTVKQQFRFAQKRTPAKAFSLLAEATHSSADRHCSMVVNELPPSVPPVSDHLKKLSSPSVSLTTAGDSPVEEPPVAAVDITQFVLVDPPDEPLDVFPPMDVNAEVMPTRSLPPGIPVLPSPSILPSQRPKTRCSKRLRSSAAPEVNPPAPAPKLRLRHTSGDVKLEAACSKLLNTLHKPSPTKVSTLMSQLRRSTKSDYSICGTVFPATLFFDLLKPQQWVSSMQHMDLLISFVWDTYNPFFITRRITILDSMFTSIISNKYMSFKQHNNNKAFVWHPLLISYVKGQVSPRRPELQWMRDVDTVYLPMNWGTRHWVGLAIDLKKGHIDILDPFEDLTSARKVVSFMSPFAQMLPELILSVCGSIPALWPDTAFTFTRVPGLAQNKRGGDCGPLSVKFMEFTMLGLQSSLLNITPTQIDNARLRYALDIYETYVNKL
ncbi:predicted protein [Arabidopsis lyrata subsp. lyrata]|uniref:Predicted protein n=1 Tax=Arabidopsis lyrata subsp. lyrata TaxID=81972 RepID=D7MKU6_ARALL|nr:predicted protein [Arabidopsis lyrata subsp. lyrata]